MTASFGPHRASGAVVLFLAKVGPVCGALVRPNGEVVPPFDREAALFSGWALVYPKVASPHLGVAILVLL